jgi:hypothetical protein
MTTLNTSKTAKKSVRKSLPKIREDICKFINRTKRRGMTCDEVEAVYGYTHQTASARINELRNLGQLIDSGERRLTRSGRPATVWITVPHA